MITQFEWAWQNPKKSRRLRHVANKTSKEKGIDFCFRVLSAMLNVGPWNRLPLTIRWLKQEYRMDFDVEQQPPIHMPIVYGPLNKRKPRKGNNGGSNEVEEVNSTSYRCVECSKKIKVYNIHFPLACEQAPWRSAANLAQSAKQGTLAEHFATCWRCFVPNLLCFIKSQEPVCTLIFHYL